MQMSLLLYEIVKISVTLKSTDAGLYKKYTDAEGKGKTILLIADIKGVTLYDV